MRVVEIQSQISVKTEKAIQAIAFKLYDSEQLIGEFTIQFDIHWQLKNRYFYGDVIESSIAITHVSDGLDIAPLERLLLDWIHDLYREPRELISRTPQQMIVDIPYIGITRTKLIPSPTLF
ncbi:hypothetical protein JCM19241_3294 [Vibrio ishigakensis]|uniref:Uncharacterized protein n=1 Tax=Vibrio ishigakensis TaxID=1481914 RepID=A0A0B8QEF7_9VIBR|nr:hypothetical protein JCM19241_3294 [Vibrio ishigakensis]